LEEFVFQSRKGNCEYYATAMAVMLRVAGIPSRVVAGYHGGLYNDSGGYYVVNQANAHVWVESWDESERAWRRYDPTPASNEAGGGADEEEQYGFFWKYVDYINYSMSRIFMEYEGDTQSKLLDVIREFVTSPGDKIGAAIDKLYKDKRKALVLAAVFIAICLAYAGKKYLRYVGTRERRSRDDVLRERFLSAMKRRGFVKKAGDGLEEFTDEVVSALGPGNMIARAAADFVASFEAYYFRDIPIEPAEFRRLEVLIKSVKTQRARP
jgi:hypothetical protein